MITAFVVALAFPLVYWATGGLETLLAATAVLWFILVLVSALSVERLTARGIAAFGGSTVLIVTVRPDTMVVAALVVVSCLAVALISNVLSDRTNRWIPVIDARRAGVLMLGVIGVVVFLAVFREVVFHSVLPQPEKSKIGGLSWFRAGLGYVYHSFPLWMWAVLLVFGAFGLVRCVRTRSLPGLVAFVTVITGLIVLAFSRGDWMGGARLLVPYLAPGLVLVSVGVCSLTVWWRRVGLVVLFGVECLTLGLFATDTPWLAPAYYGREPTAMTISASATGQPVWAPWRLTWGPGPHPGGVVAMPWYVAWNASHRRDAIFLAHTTPIVRDLVRQLPKGGVISIGTAQGGMVPYTWATDFPGKLRFIDRAGVSTNDFARCPARNAKSVGDLISYADWFSHAGGCAPPLPDVVFDGNSMALYPALSPYYHLVYYQDPMFIHDPANKTIDYDEPESRGEERLEPLTG